MKEFRAIFSVIRSGYAKKDHISILAVIQKIWDLHKFGLQIWIQNKNYPMKNFTLSFPNLWIYINLGCIRTQKCIRFHRFWSSGPGMRKKAWYQVRVCKKDPNISCKKIWDLHKFGLQIWIQNAKITLWKNFGQFRFHRILVIRSGYAKKDHISILAVIQKIWDLHKFGLQIWIQNAKITLWKNFGQFFRFHRFWSSGPGMQKKITSHY